MMPSGAWFAACLVASVLLHVWVLGNAQVGMRPPQPPEKVMTLVELVEETIPPTPEAPAEPPTLPPEPSVPEEPPLEELTSAEPPPEEQEILTVETLPAPATPPSTPRPSTPSMQTSKPRAPSPPAAVARAAGDRSTPVVHRNSPPRYPEFARRKGWEGRVVVRVTVEPSGRVSGVRIRTGSGFGVLDQAALQSVRSWRFDPKVMGGVAVQGVVDVPVNFSLRGR
jgi:protein TonB